MSCVTCDGLKTIPPPPEKRWLLTGEQPMPCPVCKGPHLRWLADKLEVEDQVVVCSAIDCEKELSSGWLVYAQLTSSKLPKLDEAIMLCCDDHAELEKTALQEEGHPTVCLPFCFGDAREPA